MINDMLKSTMVRQLLLAALVFLVSAAFGFFDSPSRQANWYRVSQVYDGDTIEVDMAGRYEKIRFLGIDTPETHHPTYGIECYGQEASNYLKSKLEDSFVKLEPDYLSTNRDRYDRLLRYVYDQDGQLVNRELVNLGYAFATTGFRHSKRESFIVSESKAKFDGLGLWSACQTEIRGGNTRTVILDN